jgi:hypothetical protein
MFGSWITWIGCGAVIVVFAVARKVLSKPPDKVKVDQDLPKPNKISTLVPTADGRPLLPDVIKYWVKPVVDIPIFADLPRFATKITIYAPNGQVHLPLTTIKAALRPIFEKTVVYLGEDEQRVCNGFDSELSTIDEETVDLSLALRDYVEKYVGTESKVMQLLRTCGQHIIAPAVQRLKPVFMNNGIPYKDVRGGWLIDIRYQADRISVIHKKKEQAQSYDAEDHFEFEWHLQIDLDLNVQNVIDASLTVAEYQLSPDMEKERKELVLSTMRPFLKHSASSFA